MLERVPAIAIKETRELLRDPIYLGLAFVIPMIMILLFGFGLILDIKHLPVAFVDRDGSPWSRDYRDRFVHSEYFDLVGVLDRRRPGARDHRPAAGLWPRSGTRPAGGGRRDRGRLVPEPRRDHHRLRERHQ
jgi:hypothetical protein